MLRLLSRAPLWLLHPLGAALGWCAFLLSGTYRRRFRAHAAGAGYAFGAVAAAVGHAGRMVAELPRLWFGRPPRWSWDDGGAIARAYAAGRGILFLTPHLGGFELSPQALAADYGPAHGPMTVLYRPARQPWLARLMASARLRPHMETVPTTLAGVRGLVRALRRGEAVGLLPDQVPPDGLGLWSPFFGRPAYTMTLAARLAQQTGAAVLLAWTERLPHGRGFVIHVEERAAPLPDALDAAVDALNADMERLIRRCPSQYLWGYARYKQPRRMEAPA
ncbi:lysophospholipid acyltransferase family protein [uncultured Xylophilus sp.]|uniref:lysophospholipid acyltransferase family protein n=1 Tax=uncultured Xylophilus sp. TaxID=296832 RepID=UPI0025E52DFB|nr:lysophospholipid acyltransferase family protein [uncultured Xylophilus sp.]